MVAPPASTVLSVGLPGRRRGMVSLTVAAAATSLLVLLSLGTGAVSLSPGEVLEVLFGGGTALQHAVVMVIRLPRIVMALALGAALAMSGVMLQGLLRNALADPAIVGVSSGAALGAALAIVLGPVVLGPAVVSAAVQVEVLIPVAAIVGALSVTAVVYRFGRRGASGERLILAGIALNALAAAGIGLMLDMADDDQLRNLTAWTLGGLGGTTWGQSVLVSAGVMVCLPLVLRTGAGLNALMLGSHEAMCLGVDVTSLGRRVVWLTAVLVGLGTSFVGIVGFVGLVVPHLVRLVLGAEHRRLLIISAVVGAGLLVAADLTARTLVAPRELPLGVLTSLLGGPFFLWLLSRRRAR